MRQTRAMAVLCGVALLGAPGAMLGVAPVRAKPTFTGWLFTSTVIVARPDPAQCPLCQEARLPFPVISKEGGASIAVSEASTANYEGLMGKKVKATGRYRPGAIRQQFGDGPRLEMVIEQITEVR